MASRMLDLPEPLRPVMELKLSSLRRGCQRMHLAASASGLFYHPEITVRTAYDLKPCCCTCQSHILSHIGVGVGQRGRTSMITSVTLMAAAALGLGLSSSSSWLSSSLSRQKKAPFLA